MAEEDAITTGPVQLVSCRTSDTRFPPEVVANPKSPAESPASCPKCCVALGTSRTPESTQLPPAARVDTCRAQLDVLQVREPQTASKLSHATAIAPFGANSAPSRFRCAPEAIVVAAEPQAPPAGRCTTAMLVTPAPWRVAPTPPSQTVISIAVADVELVHAVRGAGRPSSATSRVIHKGCAQCGIRIDRRRSTAGAGADLGAATRGTDGPGDVDRHRPRLTESGGASPDLVYGAPTRRLILKPNGGQIAGRVDGNGSLISASSKHNLRVPPRPSRHSREDSKDAENRITKRRMVRQHGLPPMD